MASGITVTGLDKLQKAMAKLSVAMQDQTPVMSAIGEAFLESVDTNFSVGGRPSWKALKAATLKKRREGRNTINTAKILVDTGALRRSIWKRVGKTWVEIGTNKKYAATHQYGRGKIPARSFLVPQEEDYIEAAETIADSLVAILRKP